MTLTDFLAGTRPLVRLEILDVRGSAPRDAGTVMYVAGDGLCGTVGGGRLEYMAVDEARRMIARGETEHSLTLPLGPEIGQCCGGRVKIALRLLDTAGREAARRAAEEERAALPAVLLLGAGHVGRAIADLMQHLPVRVKLIDERDAELARCTAEVETRRTAMAEAEIGAAPAGSAFVIATHDHALDFLLTAAALERGDAAYVGMIGSRSKRAKFLGWCKAEQAGLETGRLVCPIGENTTRDKRPAVIAAMVVAEVMGVLSAREMPGEDGQTGAKVGARTRS